MYMHGAPTSEIIRDAKARAKVSVPLPSDREREAMVAAFIAERGVTSAKPAFAVPCPQAAKPLPPAVPAAKTQVERPSEFDLKIAAAYTTKVGTIKEIGAEFGVCEQAASKALKRCGITQKPAHLKKARKVALKDAAPLTENEAQAIEHYRNHQPMTVRQVATKFGVPYDHMRHLLARAGIQRLSRWMAGALGSAQRRDSDPSIVSELHPA